MNYAAMFLAELGVLIACVGGMVAGPWRATLLVFVGGLFAQIALRLYGA